MAEMLKSSTQYPTNVFPPSRCQLNLHTTHRQIATLRAWWLIASLVRRKPGFLRPSFVGMRSTVIHDYGMQSREYIPVNLFRGLASLDKRR